MIIFILALAPIFGLALGLAVAAVIKRRNERRALRTMAAMKLWLTTEHNVTF